MVALEVAKAGESIGRKVDWPFQLPIQNPVVPGDRGEPSTVFT